MPIYEYRCAKCGVFEVTRRITEPALKRCPTCKGKVERLMSATSFVLKGSGWYATDYAKSGSQSKSESAKRDQIRDQIRYQVRHQVREQVRQQIQRHHGRDREQLGFRKQVLGQLVGFVRQDQDFDQQVRRLSGAYAAG